MAPDLGRFRRSVMGAPRCRVMEAPVFFCRHDPSGLLSIDNNVIRKVDVLGEPEDDRNAGPGETRSRPTEIVVAMPRCELQTALKTLDVDATLSTDGPNGEASRLEEAEDCLPGVVKEVGVLKVPVVQRTQGTRDRAKAQGVTSVDEKGDESVVAGNLDDELRIPVEDDHPFRLMAITYSD